MYYSAQTSPTLSTLILVAMLPRVDNERHRPAFLRTAPKAQAPSNEVCVSRTIFLRGSDAIVDCPVRLSISVAKHREGNQVER